MTASGERWTVELKWQNKVVGEKELTALAAKAQALAARLWCISRSGFTPAARTYAGAHDILISTRADLEKLEKAVK
ncbi:MAG: restriction endonuclease [Chloroflexi bacterium]|nr:restriction endonuclease [Chloroflexota bacterium]